MDIKKVLDLLRSTYTEQLYDRKANYIIKFCRERKDGFYYDEIPDLREIVETTISDLKEGVQEMRTALKKICEVASLPFKQKKASDEYYCQKDKTLPPLLNAFKPILTTQKYLELNEGNSSADANVIINIFSDDLRLAVLNFLHSFINEGIDEIRLQEESYEEKKIQGAESSPIQRLIEKGTKNLRAFDESELAENIVYMMQHYSKNIEFLVKIFEIILICGLYKPLAYKFVNFGILKDIINIIFETKDYRSYLVVLALDIIWNIIDSVGVSALKSFATEEIINELKTLFENLMKSGYKLEDKGLRNEMLILINYLMSDSQALPYFFEKSNFPTHSKMHSFLEILIHYSTIDEMTFYSQPIRTNDMKAFFNTTSEDLEFKKLIWSGILTALQSNHPKVVLTVKNSSFISSLILYIDPLANSYAVNRWSSPQLREIQLHCLSILANVILYMKDEFYERNGLFSLTKFLTNTNDNERREKCLKAFANISLYDEEEYKLKISDEGMIDILLDFIQNEVENSLEIRELCFSILSNLCKNCVKNKKLFRKKNGIELIISALKDSNIGISPNYALYTLAVLDCLWNAVLGNRKNENIFLENEGLYVLMEFLEICGLLQRKMSLSCLCYLIENPKAINYFCDWNSSRTMINATQLLIKLYELEDQRFNVKYKDGILQVIDRPLNPKTRKIPVNENTTNANNQSAQKYGTSKMSLTNYTPRGTNNLEQEEDPDDSFAQHVKKTKGQSLSESLTKTKGFAKLKDALKAGESDTSVGAEAFLINKLQDKVEEYDLRAIIFAILYRTGFDRNELQPHQTQRLEVIQVYPHFKMGEIWNDIKYELEQEERVKPTSDDYHWMITNIEEIQDIAVNCVNTQQMIAREFRKQQEEDLNKFYDIIRSNKLGK